MQQSQPMRLCIHGHFYQPPRENPWTSAIEAQESAAPHHDWNERISRECYAPNGASRLLDAKGRIRGIVNNYRWMSFNFGPTLLEWIARHDPETLERIREADRLSLEDQNGHGNAIAQVYNHAILPLGTDRDRATQIAWGLQDFRDRFGREAEGMWLAETGINMDTIVALIQAGVKFTVLAPSQADRVRSFGEDAWKDVSDNSIDPSRPYRVYPVDASGEPLCAGHLDIFFYDGPISSAVGFEHLLRDAEGYLARLKAAWTDGDPLPRLVAVGTDGESYGHHEPFGDMALAYLYDTLAPRDRIVPTNFGHFLSLRTPAEEVRLKNAHGEGTAWSCAHGTGRWQRDCGCSTGGGSNWNQSWRTPLRAAMDRARKAAEDCWDRLSPGLFSSPWNARVSWISTRTDRLSRKEWLDSSLLPGQRSRERDALTLMELVRMGQFCLTSCAWFFDDLGGLEPVQNMRYACRVCELLSDLGDSSPEEEIRSILAQAKSNVEGRTGDWIWDHWVKQRVNPTHKLAARAVLHHRMQQETPRDLDIPWAVRDASSPLPEFLQAKVVLNDPATAAPRVFRCLAQVVLGGSARTWILEGDVPFPVVDWNGGGADLASRISASWQGGPIEAGELDRDARQELAETRIRHSMQEVHADLEALDEHASKARLDIQALHVPVPNHLSFARRILLEEALATSVLQVLEDPAVSVVNDIRSALECARAEGLDLRLSLPGRHFDRRLQDLMSIVWEHPESSDVATLVLLLDLAEEAGLPVSKAPLENLAARLRNERLHPILRKPQFLDEERRQCILWVDVLERLNFDMDIERELLGLPSQEQIALERKAEA